jgi:hypothetical protein
VANIGYGRDATHTKVLDDELSGMATGRISLPLRHPEVVEPDDEYDLSVVRMITQKYTLYSRLIRLIGLLRLSFSGR